MKATDIQLNSLVNKAIEGHQYAFKALYNQFSNAMFNICIRMTADRQESEDITQEAFFLAFQKLNQLKEKKAFAGWLRRIVITICLQRIKSKINFEQFSSDHEVEDEGIEWVEFDIDKLYGAIKYLPEGCRQIFLLYVTEDYSHKEIAKSLNISESTSKSQYARAKNF
ncbi:MAG: sigma-70 family RNA polymerase sigma factor [Chitinophagaceae bacterium]